MTKCLSFLVFIFASLISRSVQQCEDYVPIAEDMYNRTYTQITSPTANEIRPLGFKVAILPFGGPRPCSNVADTGGNMRHLEVKWEMELPGRLCYSANNGVPICNTGENFQSCATVPGSSTSVTFEFLCEGDGCEGGDRMFWYRFVVESLVDGGYDENWCSTRDSDFPSSLVPLPSLPPPTTTTKKGGAGSPHLSRWKMMSLLFLPAVITASTLFQ